MIVKLTIIDDCPLIKLSQNYDAKPLIMKLLKYKKYFNIIFNFNKLHIRKFSLL